jgi:hypothetical protein
MFTLDQCKRLKELGFPQHDDPERYRHDGADGKWWYRITDSDDVADIGTPNQPHWIIAYSPTLDEVITWFDEELYMFTGDKREGKDALVISASTRFYTNGPDLPSALVALAEKKKEKRDGTL